MAVLARPLRSKHREENTRNSSAKPKTTTQSPNEQILSMAIAHRTLNHHSSRSITMNTNEGGIMPWKSQREAAHASARLERLATDTLQRPRIGEGTKTESSSSAIQNTNTTNSA